MAPLPRYTPAGITVAAPQPVPIAGAQAAASAFNTLSRGLDRITNFAFRQAMQQAAVEGAEYGADKAPTIEQIKQAQEDGDPVNVPGDTSTVFGRAARQAALRNMRLSIEANATQEMAKLHAQVIKTEIPADQYAAQLNNIAAGSAAALAQVSPSAAGALRASLAATASTQYKVHATQLARKAEERRKVEAFSAISQIVDSVDKIFDASQMENEAWYAAGQEWLESPDETMLASKKNMILKLANSVGDLTLAKQGLDRFNLRVKTARINTAAKWAENEDGSISVEKERAFRTGNVAGTPVESIYMSMSLEDRKSALNEMVRRSQQFDDVEAANEAASTRRLNREIKKRSMDFADAFESRDPQKIDFALKQIHQLGDYDTWKKFKDIAVKKDYPTDPSLKVDLISRINAGEISRNRILTEHSLGRLSHTDAINLMKMVKENNNPELQSNYSRYKEAVGFPPSNVLLSQYTRAEAIRRVNAMGVILRNELNRVKATGDRPNFKKIVDDAIAEYKNATLSPNDRKSKIESLKNAMKFVPVLKGTFDPDASSNNKNLESMERAILKLQLEKPKEADKYNLYLKNIKDLIEDNDKISAKSVKSTQSPATAGFPPEFMPATPLSEQQRLRAIQTYGLGQ